MADALMLVVVFVATTLFCHAWKDQNKACTDVPKYVVVQHSQVDRGENLFLVSALSL